MPVPYGPEAGAGYGTSGGSAQLGPDATLVVHITSPDGTAHKQYPCPPDARWTATVPGGYDEWTGTLDEAWGQGPIGEALQNDSLLRVIDRRTAETAWWGRVTDPGARSNRIQSRSQVSAAGPAAELATIVRPVCYIDRDLSRWISRNTYPAASTQIVDTPGMTWWPGDPIATNPSQAIEMGIPQSTDIKTGDSETLDYRHPLFNADGPGNWVVSVYGSVKTTSTPANTLKVFVNDNAGGLSYVETIAWNTANTQQNWGSYMGDADWSASRAGTISVRFQRDGTNVTTTANMWVRWANLMVLGQRRDINGGLVTPAAHNYNVTLGQILADLIGRFLPGYDAGDVRFPSDIVDQACWWDGISAEELADWLVENNPDYWWAVAEPRIGGTKPTFLFRPWVQTSRWGQYASGVRYLLTPENSTIQLTGGADGVANRALVVYQQTEGLNASDYVTVPVPALDQLGLVRTIKVDLTGSGPMIGWRARAIGVAQLKEQAAWKSSGTVDVTGPVLDQVTGRMVQPWEIEPGWPAYVLPRAPRGSAIIPPVTDGSSLFRVTGVQYTASSNTATLALDGGSRSMLARRGQVVPRRSPGHTGASYSGSHR